MRKLRLFPLLLLLLGMILNIENTEGRGCGTKHQVCECQRLKREKRIIGGEEAGRFGHPYQARILVHWRLGKTRKVQQCGGTLISPEWVLTAGQCVTWAKARSRRVKPFFQIRLGEHRKDNLDEMSDVQSFKSKKFILHPSFARTRSPSVKNDIALIRLEQPAKLTMAVSPACLPKALRLQDLNDKEITTLGWGRTSVESYVKSNVLKKLDMKALSHQECVQPNYMWMSDEVTDSMFCGKAKAASICIGDIGGPVVYEANGHTYVVGINSFVSKERCVNHHFPMVFVRVSSYIDWIEEATGNEFCSI